MSKAYINGLMSSFTLMPSRSETIDIDRVRELYGDIPTLSWCSNQLKRDAAAHRIQSAIDRLMFVEKDLRATLKVDDRHKGKAKAEGPKMILKHAIVTGTPDQKTSLCSGKVMFNGINEGVSPEATLSSLKFVYSDGENGVRDRLSLVEDWANVSKDIYSASRDNI